MLSCKGVENTGVQKLLLDNNLFEIPQVTIHEAIEKVMFQVQHHNLLPDCLCSQDTFNSLALQSFWTLPLQT